MRRLFLIVAIVGTLACGPVGSSDIALNGKAGDDIRTNEFDMQADSYAVRWNVDHNSACSMVMVLFDSKTEEQYPLVFEPTPTMTSSGAFNLKANSTGQILGTTITTYHKGKHYLRVADPDCSPGTWKVTLSPA